MKKTLLKNIALALVGSLYVVGPANAAPMLDGGLSMSGTDTVDASYETIAVKDATGITFGGYFIIGPDNTLAVATATGNFARLVDGDVQPTGDIENFQFASYIPTPGTAFSTAGDFSFEMASLTWERDTAAGNTHIHVYGLGLMRTEGFDNTPGEWNFTGGITDANFSWPASSRTAPISEPATMMLFGAGLIGLAGIMRAGEKNRSKKCDIS